MSVNRGRMIFKNYRDFRNKSIEKGFDFLEESDDKELLVALLKDIISMSDIDNIDFDNALLLARIKLKK